MDNKTEEVTEIEKDLDTAIAEEEAVVCLLYTSDAADE